MARKKIREHDGKRLLKKHLVRVANLNLPLHSVLVDRDTNFQKVAQENPWLLSNKLVAKPDMLFGKRGKNNLVLLDATYQQAEEFVQKWFDKETEISGVKGVMTHWLIEPFVPHKVEYYISIASHPEHDEIHFSLRGGIHVEENWDQVKHLQVTPLQTLANIPDWEKSLGIDQIPAEYKQKTFEFVKALYQIFVELDFVALELNPFTFNAAGEIVPLDLVAEVDDCAAFKNTKNWDGLTFPNPFGRRLNAEEAFIHSLDEKTGASLKLTILNPKGRIWLMVAGGGASVIFADTVADLHMGPELGNYGEYSGNPNEEETCHYAKTILDLATRNPDGHGRVLIIGGGIANFTDVAKTFKGIIHALNEYREKLIAAKMKIFVRRAGPNYQAALKAMRELSDKLKVPIEVYGPEIPMTTILPKAIEYIKSS